MRGVSAAEVVNLVTSLEPDFAQVTQAKQTLMSSYLRSRKSADIQDIFHCRKHVTASMQHDLHAEHALLAQIGPEMLAFLL